MAWRDVTLGRLVAAAVVAVALVGCSATGSSDSATTTTEVGPAIEDLEALLPTAADLGHGFQDVPTDDDEGDPEIQEAMIAACPAAERFMHDDDSDGPVAIREFEASDGRGFSVELDPTPRNLGEDVLDDVIAAINECDEIEVSLDGGTDVSVVLSAEREDALGDRGVRLGQDVTMRHPSLSEEVAFSTAGWTYLFETIAVKVSTTDGVANDGTVTPADPELVDDAATELEGRLDALLNG